MKPKFLRVTDSAPEKIKVVIEGQTNETTTYTDSRNPVLLVFNRSSQKELIEYTAIQNLYHKLAHAMHMMNGTWRYFVSESQAIEVENVFRRQLAQI